MHTFQRDCFGERITLERRLRRVGSARERAQECMEILAGGISLPATKEQLTLKVLTKKGDERTGSERVVSGALVDSAVAPRYPVQLG